MVFSLVIITCIKPSFAVLLQEQQEASIAEANAANAQLTIKVQQLEAQCSSLEARGKDFEQQRQHEQCYHDELVTDKQRATQVPGVA